MFSAANAALHSLGKGCFLNQIIEMGFDEGCDAVAPDGLVGKTPTERKLVLFHEPIRKDAA